MSLDLLILLLPYAFALHNIEEIMGMEKWTHSIPASIHTPVTTKQFLIAVILFTIIGFLCVYLKNYYPDENIFWLTITGFAGMLFLNVFFPHLIATIYFKKYAPGVFTGVFINLPLTILIIRDIYSNHKLTLNQIGLAVFTGGLTGIFLAYTFLRIGHILINSKTK